MRAGGLEATPLRSNEVSITGAPVAEPAEAKARRLGILDRLATLFGGVPEDAWSEADQARMARGELPLGHPEHPNV